VLSEACAHEAVGLEAALVNLAVLELVVSAHALAHVLVEPSLVHRAVRKLVNAQPVLLVLVPLALVDGAIRPLVLSYAVELVIDELAIVLSSRRAHPSRAPMSASHSKKRSKKSLAAVFETATHDLARDHLQHALPVGLALIVACAHVFVAGRRLRRLGRLLCLVRHADSGVVDGLARRRRPRRNGFSSRPAALVWLGVCGWDRWWWVCGGWGGCAAKGNSRGANLRPFLRIRFPLSGAAPSALLLPRWWPRGSTRFGSPPTAVGCPPVCARRAVTMMKVATMFVAVEGALAFSLGGARASAVRAWV
jgi:hypothetical protein